MIENVENAKVNLESLIQKAVEGEEIIISQEGYPDVKLVPVKKLIYKQSDRLHNAWEGKIWMAG